MDEKEITLLSGIQQQLQKILVADLGKNKNDLLIFKEFSEKLSEALQGLGELKEVFQEKDHEDICEKLSLIQKALEIYGEKEVIVNVDAPIIPPPTVTHETHIVPESEHIQKACTLLYEILEQVKVRPTNEVKILNREVEDAIPVVLTTASRQAFYTAIVQAMASNDRVTILGTPNVNLDQVGGVDVTLGQKLSVASLPVVLSSDQTAVPVTQSGAWTFTGTVAATQSGVWTTGRTWTLSSTTDSVSIVPTTSGGLTPYKNLDVDETGVLIKNGAGQLYGYFLYNNAASTRYIKFYNKASAPTVGTDVPVLTIPIPAGSAANVEYSQGIDGFSLGIGVGATTGVADANTGAPAANDVVANIFYK